MERGPRSILVLCVDRDNDVGEVAEVETPVVGEEALEKAAVKFAVKRPDDSDVNAMFAALKIYRELRREGGFEDVEVALVAGHREEGVKADAKISAELDELFARRKFDAAVLVSDGPTDEMVLPVIQSKLPVLSVHRVVVQQSRGVEESFLLLLRYARRLFEEEKYKRYVLGIPGAILALYVTLSLTMPGYVWPLTLLALGLAMAIKGFSLDRVVADVYRSSHILFASFIASSLTAALAVIMGLTGLAELGRVGGVEALGYFLLVRVGEQVLVLDLLFISLLLPLASQMLEAILGIKRLSVSDYGAILLVILLRQVLLEYSKLLVGGGDVLTLLLWIVVTIVVLALLAALAPLAGRVLMASEGGEE